jgi:hypothetical protein
LNVLAGDQGGARPDLGIIGEYATKAFLTEAEDDWDNTRLFTLGTTFHGLATLLNEATGRIPFLNNGPPTGPGGNGNGGSYAGLGAVQNQLYWGIAAFTTFPANMANANGRLNPAGYAIQANAFPIPNTQLDHMPAFDGLTYMIFGNRHWLDLMQWQGSRDFMQQKVGPSGVTGSGGYRDNVGVFPGDGNTYHYWGLTTNCCQTRGSNWLTRDVLYPATFGHDPNVAYPDGTFNSERAMFSDMITETSNYWPIFSKFRDGPGSTAWTTSIWPIANDTIGDSSIEVTVFQAAYSMLVTYDLLAFQHVPMGGIWGTGMQNFTEGVVGMQLPGMGTSPGQTTSFYAGSFGIQPAVQLPIRRQTRRLVCSAILGNGSTASTRRILAITHHPA